MILYKTVPVKSPILENACDQRLFTKKEAINIKYILGLINYADA